MFGNHGAEALIVRVIGVISQPPLTIARHFVDKHRMIEVVVRIPVSLQDVRSRQV
jgi:hypothetical protein